MAAVAKTATESCRSCSNKNFCKAKGEKVFFIRQVCDNMHPDVYEFDNGARTGPDRLRRERANWRHIGKSRFVLSGEG